MGEGRGGDPAPGGLGSTAVFADIGYVLVAGRVVKAAKGRELLDDPDIGRLFLGG
jgi:ABC-type branched-subunit amino acid transport system ATPase component